MKTLAVFDENGYIILDDMPDIKNKKAKLLILFDEEDLKNEFYDLSMQGLSKAYSTDEPEYNQSFVKEPNPQYKKWRKVILF
ncbi:MAG: hypothetical protein ABIN97_21365 [Ginsengibacter sp.]